MTEAEKAALLALADNCQEKADFWYLDAVQHHQTCPHFADAPAVYAVDLAMLWQNRAAALRARASKEPEA